jgi:murein DD-endopeptidase MepM/ murein hydrolase activator NlpD
MSSANHGDVRGAPRAPRRVGLAAAPELGVADLFGVRSAAQLRADLGEVVAGTIARNRCQFGVSSAGLLRPALAFPAYAGRVPADRLAPVFNLFDRTHGGTRYSQRVTRKWQRDYRGGRLSYDDHAGTDFVCPPATTLCAAAPGVVAALRDRWLRGGLTVCVDHGLGVVTQYTHCWRALVEPGERVVRGQPVALSGSSGFDMAGFFPWVPPHIHFTVFRGGRAIDPFLADDEPDGPGTWLDRNAPRPSGPLAEDPDRPSPTPVDEAAFDRVVATCGNARIKAEIVAAADEPQELAAILEDALLFDEWAWPPEVRQTRLRQPTRPGVDGQPKDVRLTLPLPRESYDGVFLADTTQTLPLS